MLRTCHPVINMIRLKKVFGGRGRGCTVAEGPQQRLRCLTHKFVIVYQPAVAICGWRQLVKSVIRCPVINMIRLKKVFGGRGRGCAVADLNRISLPHAQICHRLSTCCGDLRLASAREIRHPVPCHQHDPIEENLRRTQPAVAICGWRRCCSRAGSADTQTRPNRPCGYLSSQLKASLCWW
jgi:hypothetical protein